MALAFWRYSRQVENSGKQDRWSFRNDT